MRFGPDRAAVPHRIAVIGSGPRGLSVVERMGARLAAEPPRRPVEIHLIDAVEVGCGRVWRTDQPDWFLMNTVCGEVSAFSGIPDGGPARAGAGPSLVQYWASVDPRCPGPNGYAPRALHGRYMHFVLEAVERGLPPGATLHRVRAAVETLERAGDGYVLALSNGTRLHADRVILVTGHARQEQTGELAALAEFAAPRPHLRYIDGDSAADMPLDAIPAGSAVGILGLGLSFYDVMAALTLGRGGTFAEKPGGGLVYRPSGREPLLVAGSRSGMPLPARGRNQKEPLYAYTPVMFTPDRVRKNRPGRIDFKHDAVPWLLAEVNLVYYATELRNRRGADAAAEFTAAVARAAEGGVPDVSALAAHFGVDLPPVDLDRIARPFTGLAFDDPAAFERALVGELRRDLEHAEHGNVDSPLKAALDVLRDTRWVIRNLVDFSGLTPESHERDFIGWYNPRSAFLAAGPPRIRLWQTLALIEAGVLRVVGPRARFAGDERLDRFVVSSPQVAGSEVPVETVIDARIPSPDVLREAAPLTRKLYDAGVWTGYVNRHGEAEFHTGGVAVTPAPYHPLGRDGAPDTGLYVLGIPTEHTRWFMQGGSSRPGRWTDFVHDADAIAGHALAAADPIIDEELEIVEAEYEALAVGGA
ncbi:MAG: hypothetical protein QOI11_3776 [Candidatus Eremiobacteraeota bacterium]|nr:hypothetical protein [Candidatus Eremiobacteraeota bacterium]